MEALDPCWAAATVGNEAQRASMLRKTWQIGHAGCRERDANDSIGLFYRIIFNSPTWHGAIGAVPVHPLGVPVRGKRSRRKECGLGRCGRGALV